MKSELLIHPDELSDTWIRRAASHRIKRISLHPVGGKEAHHSLQDLIDRLKSSEYREKINQLMDVGVEIGYEFHAASYLLPRDLFVMHPEYFRVDENGERTPKGNFCFSSPEAVNIVAENAVKLAKSLYRSPKDFYFWLDDAKKGSCYCEACKKRSYADHQLSVLNAMLKALRKEIPDARLCYLAYYEALAVPKEVLPEEGIFLEYAPIERYTSPETSEWTDETIDLLKALTAFFGTKDAKVLEYWYDNSLFSRWKKPPVRFTLNEEQQNRDLMEYRTLGFETVASFACFLGEDYVELYGEPDLGGLETFANT